jgi:hypothetical protein
LQNRVVLALLLLEQAVAAAVVEMLVLRFYPEVVVELVLE